MKLPDLNVLLHAANAASDDHAKARAWLEAAFSAPEGVGLSWVVLLGFLRLATRRGIFPRPLAVEDALASVRDWLAAPAARALHPTERHEPILSRLLLAAGTGGNLTTDAHLAALAIEHGATLASFDRDFERFAGLAYEALA
ncbi:MAG: PIN domain-containing protein [Betaproteobacteria bacterium]|nr:MAG: PIN domain-containing protein [Betaproteobacteria bacterium]